jgi:hypothetical protein
LGQRRRAQRDQQHRGIGWVHLAVRRRDGHVDRQRALRTQAQVVENLS